jgi:hypothetical protein
MPGGGDGKRMPAPARALLVTDMDGTRQQQRMEPFEQQKLRSRSGIAALEADRVGLPLRPTAQAHSPKPHSSADTSEACR